MPREFSRASRVSEVIQREVAVIIQKEMNDPRVANVTITFTKMSRDMSTARVHFICPGDEQGIKATLRALSKASGFIRHELAGRVDLRFIPNIRFFYDVSVERGRHVTELIDQAMSRDPGHDEGEK
jgi:ribosome-binding factor A